MAPFLLYAFVAFLTFPLAAACLTITNFFGRILYVVAYKAFGPQGRMAGAMISMLSVMTLMVLSFVSIFSLDASKVVLMPPVADLKVENNKVVA